METKPAKPASGGSTIRNIVVGVATPVLAAAIIYFMGFNSHDDAKAEFKRRKKLLRRPGKHIYRTGAFFLLL